MSAARRGLRSRRGSIVVMFAVSLFAMLALAALAIDLSSLRDTKAEAQRAADVIALSGASAFRDMPWTDTKTADSARNRAFEVARQNKVRADTLDVRPFPTLTGGTMKLQSGPYPWGTMKVTKDSTKDVTIITIPDSQKVRAGSAARAWPPSSAACGESPMGTYRPWPPPGPRTRGRR
jgi:Predicted membrane protein